MTPKKSIKNIILFVGNTNSNHVKFVKSLEKHLNREFRIGLITGPQRKVSKEVEKGLDFLFRCNLKRTDLIYNALKEIKTDIACVICRYEFAMPAYSRIINLFPYLKLPTPLSVDITNDKVETRKLLTKYTPKLTPKFQVVKTISKNSVKRLIKEVGLPLIIKPASLSKSQLMTICYFEDEVETGLEDVFKKIKNLYKRNQVEKDPVVLVEQFMEGPMYSIDAYINSLGTLYHTPVVEIKTGKDAGYDDVFMYTQITPSVLEKAEEAKAHYAIERAAHAIGIRSSTIHAEIMKTEKGWKIIEIGLRPGGFRDELLHNSYKIRHTVNDFLIHMGKKPVIKRKVLNHTCFIKFWPNKAGKLKAIKGLTSVKKMSSVLKVRQGKKIGDFAGLSKNGHMYVIAFTVTGKTRSDLLGNIRKIEKTIEIQTA